MRWAAVVLASALGSCAHVGAPVAPLVATPVVLTPPRAVRLVVASPKAHCAVPVAPPLPDVSTAPDTATAVVRLKMIVRRQADLIRRQAVALKACE